MEKDIITLLLYDDLPLSFNCQKFTLKDDDDEKVSNCAEGFLSRAGFWRDRYLRLKEVHSSGRIVENGRRPTDSRGKAL
jgi:hypothetical protein